MTKLSDNEAKAILKDPHCWPTRTSKWGVRSAGEYWIRCQPVDEVGLGKVSPRLSSPGAHLFRTQPDGMWAYFKRGEFVDVIAVEVCGTIDNLNNKRSRYVSIGSSLVVSVPASWLLGEISLQHGSKAPRWKSTGCFLKKDIPTNGALQIPVRFLRVLFVIPNEDYLDWMENSVPAGHEFFMRHSSLRTATSPDTQAFLARMSFGAHFRTLR